MLKKQIFGLDISDHSLEALILKKPKFGTPRILSYSRVILRGEIVKDGVIKNSKKLEDNITKLLQSAEPRAITSPYCILSLPESQIFSTVFKMPIGLKHSEINKTISYKAEEVIPFKSSEIYYDFKTIASDGQSQEVYYVAVPIKIVDSYIQTLKNVGLELVALDLESISLSRALINKNLKSGNAKLLIDIGSRTTNLNIFDRNGIRQSTALSIGGNRFTKVISTKLGISLKEADLLKMKNGFDSTKDKGKVLLVLQNEFKRIITESQKFIEYYQSETDRKVDKIILMGGSSLLPKVDQYLADNLGVEVDIGNPLTSVRAGKFSILQNSSVIFSNVIGLALRGLSKNPVNSDINLLPFERSRFTIVPASTQRGAWRKIYIMTGIFILLALGLFGLKQYKSMNVSPSVNLNNNIINQDINLELLDKLRMEGLEVEEVSTTTPTSTEPIFIVTIKPTTSGSLNVRESASATAPKVGQVNSGSEFVLLNQLDSWYEIEYLEGLNGWISADFAEVIQQKVELDENMVKEDIIKEDEGVAEDKSEVISNEVLFRVKIFNNEVGYLTFRSGPGTANAKLGQLELGSEHEVYEEKIGWYRIKVNGLDGWISSVYVDKLQ